MKIGLSLSKCVRDIAEGIVKDEDVLVLVTGTMFNFKESKQWDSIWNGYAWGPWSGLEHDQIYAIVEKLYTDGKLHMPRNFGGYPQPTRKDDHWLETILDPAFTDMTESELEAWNQYKFIAGLSGKVVNT